MPRKLPEKGRPPLLGNTEKLRQLVRDIGNIAVAEAAGITPQFLSRVVAGKEAVSWYTLLDIARATGVSPYVLAIPPEYMVVSSRAAEQLHALETFRRLVSEPDPVEQPGDGAMNAFLNLVATHRH